MADPGDARQQAAERLEAWSDDDLHLIRSVRSHEPIYANPAALRADVRLLLARMQELKGELLSTRLARYAAHEAMVGFRTKAKEAEARAESYLRIPASEADAENVVLRRALRDIADLPEPLNNKNSALNQCEYLKQLARAVLDGDA